MADLANDNSPLVKLAAAILDDPHGISTEAWQCLIDLCQQIYGTGTRPYGVETMVPALMQKIMLSIKGGEDRVYLPEGWNG